MLRKLGKYELLEEIGHGGMATVYRARDVTLDRRVAVKLLHPHLQKTPEARIRFTREAKSVARLRHPNVLEVYDYAGEDSEESFISVELLTGPTLKQFVDTQPPMPAEIAACFGIQIARALAAAHEQGIVHRDVKPENVLLHEDRIVKLTDFGIAQMVDAQSFTATGQILGSPGHMAPEQIEAGDVDERSDVFSLGTVLYFLALHRLPFVGRNPHQVLKRIVDGDYPDPLRVDPAIGARFAGVIEQAMAHDAADRFPSAIEVEHALSDFLNELSIEDPDALLRDYLRHPERVRPELRKRTLGRLLELARAASRRGDRNAALRHCNRILALDDGNEEALSVVQRLGSRDRRPLLLGVLAALAFAAAGGVYAIANGVDDPRPPVLIPEDASIVDAHIDATAVDSGSVDASNPDAGGTVDSPDDEDPASQAIRVTRRAPALPATREVVFRPSPQNVQIAVDDQPYRSFGPAFRSVELPTGVHRFRFEGGAGCCEPLDLRVDVTPAREPLVLARTLDFRPALLVVRSNVLPATVRVASHGDTPSAEGSAGTPLQVPLGGASEVRRITVTGAEGQTFTGLIRLEAGKPSQVQVRLAPGAEGTPSIQGPVP